MRSVAGFVAACALAALTPHLGPPPPPVSPAVQTVWPKALGGRPLRSVAPSTRDARFPGAVGRFTDGRRAIVVRHIVEASRRVHPARDCYRGSGFTVRSLTARRDEQGHVWSRFLAERDGEGLVVSERVYEENGDQSWSDVSSWYWASLLGRTQGPWWAIITVDRPRSRHRTEPTPRNAKD